MSNKSYASSTEEQIRNLEAIGEQLEGLLAPLYERRIAETRILSDEDREELLEQFAPEEADREDTYAIRMCTQYFSRGNHDCTDEELLLEWFGMHGTADVVMSDDLWTQRLSHNLGAVAALGAWLARENSRGEN